jgi:NAD(P)-dependent dehydrogenase (short-subunit alcohol dehydrogenase family)
VTLDARDLGPRGITANLVHPGPTDTEMNPAEGSMAVAKRALLALDRSGRAEDIAAAVADLAGHGGGASSPGPRSRRPRLCRLTRTCPPTIAGSGGS